jgi:hypothetical protein
MLEKDHQHIKLTIGNRVLPVCEIGQRWPHINKGCIISLVSKHICVKPLWGFEAVNEQ